MGGAPQRSAEVVPAQPLNKVISDPNPDYLASLIE
jgi:hypothetical protein